MCLTSFVRIEVFQLNISHLVLDYCILYKIFCLTEEHTLKVVIWYFITVWYIWYPMICLHQPISLQERVFICAPMQDILDESIAAVSFNRVTIICTHRLGLCAENSKELSRTRPTIYKLACSLVWTCAGLDISRSFETYYKQIVQGNTIAEKMLVKIVG